MSVTVPSIKDTEPWWPTTKRARYDDGLCVGTDASVWLYRALPTGAIAEAKSVAERLAAAAPLLDLSRELADRTPRRVGGRRTTKSSYRTMHVLAINIPVPYRPGKGPLRAFLSEAFPRELTFQRVVLVGVQLLPSLLGSGGSALSKARAALGSVVDSFTAGVGTPLADFDRDRERVGAMMQRAGLVHASDAQMRLADAWFAIGGPPDVVTLPHADHMHFFADAAAVQGAKQAMDRCDEQGVGDEDGQPACMKWPTIRGEHAITFTSAADFDLDDDSPASPIALWADSLLLDSALAISVRGLVEPPKLTAAELARHRKANKRDIDERASQGKDQLADQQAKLKVLQDLEAQYRTGGAWPTLVDASVLVALDGIMDAAQVESIGTATVTDLHTMQYRQPGALTEMMLCSPVRSNPNLHDLPVDTLAYSGLASVSQVGDETGAHLGFTERDGQPCLLSPMAASKENTSPIFLVPGAPGTGKTALAQWLAQQFVRIKSPVVYVDPSPESDLSGPVLDAGGQVYSLDDIAAADGVLDPLRFAVRPEVAIDIATSMLTTINPWASNWQEYEVPLSMALAYGVRERGATTTGQALKVAMDAGKAPAEMVKPVLGLMESSPLFRACCGMDPNQQGLRVADGITLIRVGDTYLDLPAPGEQEPKLAKRTALALVRQMVYGSAMALSGRRGVVMLDEAWVFLGGGLSEVERLGRVARKQGVLPMLFTQRVSDALNKGLAGYISRGLILPTEDEDEAIASLKLFKIEATPERVARLVAKATTGTSTGGRGVAPNWNSMRALVSPSTGEVLRGTIGIYCDLAGRAIPVELRMPPGFLLKASTNPDDVALRKQQAQQGVA